MGMPLAFSDSSTVAKPSWETTSFAAPRTICSASFVVRLTGLFMVNSVSKKVSCAASGWPIFPIMSFRSLVRGAIIAFICSGSMENAACALPMVF